MREVLPFPTLQILFAKKLENGMNCCFSTGFRAGDKENRNSALDYNEDRFPQIPTSLATCAQKHFVLRSGARARERWGEKGKYTKREFSSYSKFGY